jgi:hypothetical protein
MVKFGGILRGMTAESVHGMLDAVNGEHFLNKPHDALRCKAWKTPKVLMKWELSYLRQDVRGYKESDLFSDSQLPARIRRTVGTEH